MPRKRDVLEVLKRDELLAAADRLDVPVRDRRSRDGLIGALAASRKAGLSGILEGLSRDRLKEACRTLGLDDSGREKVVLIDRAAGRRVAPRGAYQGKAKAGSWDLLHQMTATMADENQASLPGRMPPNRVVHFGLLYPEVGNAARAVK